MSRVISEGLGSLSMGFGVQPSQDHPMVANDRENLEPSLFCPLRSIKSPVFLDSGIFSSWSDQTQYSQAEKPSCQHSVAAVTQSLHATPMLSAPVPSAILESTRPT
jgi:hypothetical protein